ncbi:MAG: NADH-quinone oxidoreductase subunit C [Nitrospiraceae bacterium]
MRVAAPRIVEIARWLHDTPEAATRSHHGHLLGRLPDHPERFEVVYQLLSLPHRRRIRLKARVTEDAPAIASVTGIWKGAEFMEREVYDLMGITFTGHPDLRRILLPEDYEEGHPLRKDFPTEGRGWRSTFPFIPRLDEEPPAEHAEGARSPLRTSRHS